MICPDFQGVVATLEVVAESFQGPEDCKELFVVDFVILFGGLERFRKVSNGVEVVQGIRLFEDGASGEITGIRDETEWVTVVQEGEHRSSGKGMDECTEGRVLVGSPEEGNVF
jgi:hypothetical protein